MGMSAIDFHGNHGLWLSLSMYVPNYDLGEARR